MGYYDKRSAKVRMAVELEKRGWKILGFKEDESDSMTDYYSPADWDGIATKNGYVLVVDEPGYYSGKNIEIWNPNYKNVAVENLDKINVLLKMTQENGCTKGEEDNAKRLIEKLKNKNNDKNIDNERYIKVGEYPTYTGTKKGCIWHIEKDGALVDRGNSITFINDMPDSWTFDIDTMEYKDNYKWYWDYENGEEVRKERTLSEGGKAAINKFKSLILRIERAAMGITSCGDGTKETEVAAKQQQEENKLEKKIVSKKITKTILEKVDRVQEGSLRVNDVVFCNNTGYVKVLEVKKDLYYCVKLGNKSRGYQESKKIFVNLCKKSFDRAITREKKDYRLEVYNKIEKTEVIQEERWVRVNKRSAKKNNLSEEKTEVKENTIEKNVNNNLTIKFNNKLNGIELYFSSKPSEEILKTVKENGFRYKRDKVNNVSWWWAKDTEERRDFIKTLEGIQETTEPLAAQEKEINIDSIVDQSSSIIDNLNLSKVEYWNNKEYREQLFNYINTILKLSKRDLKVAINLLKAHEEYKHYNNLIDTLEGFLKPSKLQPTEEQLKKQQEEKLNTIREKIQKQIDSNNKNIESLSGNYKVNTHKRMREQESRDSKVRYWNKDNVFLTYIIDNISILSDVFISLGLTKTLREDMESYYRLRLNKEDYKYIDKENVYPKIQYRYELDNWINVEAKKKIKRLQKVGLNSNYQLIQFLDNEYSKLIESIEGNTENIRKKQELQKKINRCIMQQKGDINFTPKELVNYIINEAHIREGEKILEPSAGIGNIADIVKEYTSNVDTIELYQDHQEILKEKGFNVIGSDTMEATGEYDKIIMNPPFSKEQEHIRHLVNNCLRVGGKLVSITSPHWTFAKDKKSQEFRDWLDNEVHYYTLDSDIKFTHTNVNYKILVIEKF